MTRVLHYAILVTGVALIGVALYHAYGHPVIGAVLRAWLFIAAWAVLFEGERRRR